MNENDNLGPLILMITWSMTGVATLFLAARLYIKIYLRSGIGAWWDDAVLAASLIMLLAFNGSITYATFDGLGRHLHDLDLSSSNSLQLAIPIAFTCSMLGAAWSKTSFALTLIRLTRRNTMLRNSLWFIVVSLNAVMVFNAVLQFIWCQPAWTLWSGRTFAGGECWSPWVLIGYSMAAVGYLGIIDLTLAIIPWLIISKLKMDMKEKIGVAVCMSLGTVGGVTSIFRAIHLSSLNTADFSYSESELLILTGAELATTITAASIPVLRPMLRSGFRNILQSTCPNRDRPKTGSMMLSDDMSRSQSYKKMVSDNGAGLTKRQTNMATLSEVRESEESLPSLPLQTFQHDLERGGIIKTEEIEVHYENGADHPRTTGPQGFDPGDISPVYVRSESVSSWRKSRSVQLLRWPSSTFS